MLIGGYPPFQGKNLKDLFRKIRSADFIFHEIYWQNASVESKRLISHLLAVNPETRLSAAEALQSDWFVKSDAESLRSRDLSLNLEAIRAFLPKTKWKAAIHAVRVATAAPFWDPDAVGFQSKLQDLLEDESDDEAKPMVSEQESASSDADKAKLKRTLKFLDLYELKRKLRKGSYATVWECIHKETGEEYAVKIIARKELDPKEDETILNEVSMMLSLTGNKYVVQLYDFIEEKDAFYLVMENMTGGDVFDRIISMKRYTEKDARDLVIVLLKAVSSMHEIGIAHRDIKPQNLLLKSFANNANVKIGDFGFARRVHTPESLTSRVGTPSYVAPEVRLCSLNVVLSS
jgi:serine/threonine protein kinase